MFYIFKVSSLIILSSTSQFIPFVAFVDALLECVIWSFFILKSEENETKLISRPSYVSHSVALCSDKLSSQSYCRQIMQFTKELFDNVQIYFRIKRDNCSRISIKKL